MKLPALDGQKIVSDTNFSLPTTKSNKLNNTDEKSFNKILKESIQAVDTLQKEADKAIFDFATGESKKIHETMIAINKANISFQMTMHIRNKLVEAYEEVMRMQV
ncbi:MAG: flagellar hook-basal body complex protein FliE [Thermodesulfobacteriota bacterium]|nr:flagellar hook-basal body complex protein FliE [Thermodesulfobacteriota bacterium]